MVHRLMNLSHKLKDPQVSFQPVNALRSTPLYVATASNGMEFKYFLTCDDLQVDKQELVGQV